MTDAIAHQRCGRLELKVKELEELLEQALRRIEALEAFNRPIGGSDYIVDMTDPLR